MDLLGKRMKEIIFKARLTEEERLAVAALCDGPCSAQGLAERLGLAHLIRANGLLGRAGHKVFNASPENSEIRRWHPKDWDGGWYHVLAPGRRSEIDKKFYWEIRPSVLKAFVSLGWYASLQNLKTAAVDDFDPRYEGAEVMRLISARERDPELRAACIRLHGYRCHVCGVDLGEVYGALGRDFIHVHHLRPLAGRKAGSLTDPKKDLIPVCPNCHSIIHRGGVVRSLDEIRRHLRMPSQSSIPSAAQL